MTPDDSGRNRRGRDRRGARDASVALADAGTVSIEAGLAGAFGVGIVAAVLLAFVSRRIPDSQAG